MVGNKLLDYKLNTKFLKKETIEMKKTAQLHLKK